MLLLIVTALLGLIIAYVLYTILTSSGSDLPDNSFEAFLIDSPVTENPGSHKDGSKKSKLSFQPQYELPGRQILILYATEYGFSQSLAEELFNLISQRPDCSSSQPYPWQPRVVNAKNFNKIDLTQESVLLVIISTAGDGVPPTDGRDFVKTIQTMGPRSVPHLHYSVLALGDSNYVYYCRAGRTVDSRLSEVGATCLTERRDVDSEDREKISDWFTAVLKALDSLETLPRLDYLRPIEDEAEDESSYTRDRPYMAVLKTRYSLTNSVGLADDKETIHCEFDLADSGITWTAGDALGIYPCNDTVEIESIIRSLGLSGQEVVSVPKWAYLHQQDDSISISNALELCYDLKHVKPELLQLLLAHSTVGSASHKQLTELLKDGLFKSNSRLHEYLYEREIRDVLKQFKDAAASVLAFNSSSKQEGLEKLLQEIRPLLPRYYSMSSSWIVDQTTVCVTAAVVRYETLGIARSGVTTTYLQDRINIGQRCPVFISKNPDFRLPTDGNTPIIMIGPGTGIAPFRAFIQERLHCGAEGANLFYFGCRREKQDFLYADQLNGWQSDGKLTLRVAFSRDDPTHKTYVQHLLAQDAMAIWGMIQHGAHIYVCGDARNMAHDVHCALVHIVLTHGKTVHKKNSASLENEAQKAEKSEKNGNAVFIGDDDKNVINGNVLTNGTPSHADEILHDINTVVSTEKSNLVDNNVPDGISGRASHDYTNLHDGSSVTGNETVNRHTDSNDKNDNSGKILQYDNKEIFRNSHIKVHKDGSLRVDERFYDDAVSHLKDEMTEEEAELFLKNMEEEGRYQKDCWIT